MAESDVALADQVRDKLLAEQVRQKLEVERANWQAKAEASDAHTWEQSLDAYLESAGRQYTDNALALIPGVSGLAGDALATTAAVPNFAGQSLDALFEGRDAPSFGDVVAQEKDQFPASLLRSFSAPTTAGLEADTRALPALFPGGDTFSERKALKLNEIKDRRAKQQEKHPIATGLGDITGDIGSLITLRKGAGLPGKMKRLEDRLSRPLIPPRIDAGTAKQLEGAINSGPVRALAKGAGRTTEAGIEAIALDIMHSDDPWETLPYAAGLQVAESGTLQLVKNTLSGGKGGAASGIAIAAIATGTVLELLRDTMPGDESNWVTSMDDGLEKVRWTLLAGFISGLAGGGRIRNKAQMNNLVENIPWAADALTAIPRTGLLSIVEGYASADEKSRQQIETSLESLKDPGNFNEETATRLMEAIRAGDGFDALLEMPQEDAKDDGFMDVLRAIPSKNFAVP